MLYAGITLTSKLSKSIREKEGLCYSIYSVYNSNYGYLVIFTGISKNNVNHVLSKIQDEITLMAKGKISDTEIDNAKQSFINDIETIDDDIFANLRLYDKYALINENIDKSKLIKYYKKISKSELQDIAKNLKIKTYVVLTSEDSNEDKKI